MSTWQRRADTAPLGYTVQSLRLGALVSRRRWLPLVPAALLMLIGFARLHSALHAVPAHQYDIVASGNLAWSDIASIYGRDDLSGHAFPYIHGHSLEYPVLTGVMFWLAGFAGYATNVTPAFVANYVVLALAGLALLALIARQPAANPWLFALSPALVLYTGANWDLLALLPGVAALLLYRDGRDVPATLLLALSVWLKFFAILWLPLVLIERARLRQWRAVAGITAVFTALSVAINLPFALRDQYEWGLFFSFNRVRAAEVNFWTIFRDHPPSVDTVNNLSALGVLLGLAALGLLQWRSRESILMPAAAAILTWFFFLNKVYSPQYFIWLVPFLALLAAPLWLFLLLSAVDVIYYVASFQILYMVKVPSDPGVQGLSAWDFDHVLMPSMELRELAFLVLIAWLVLCRLRRPEARAVVADTTAAAAGAGGVARGA